MSAVCATGAGVHSIGFLQCVCEIRTAAPAWGGEESGSVRAEQVKISSTQAASLRARGGASRAGGSVWGTPPPTLVVAVDHTSTPSQQGGGGIGLPAESQCGICGFVYTTTVSRRSDRDCDNTTTHNTRVKTSLMKRGYTSSDENGRRSSVSLLGVKSTVDPRKVEKTVQNSLNTK